MPHLEITSEHLIVHLGFWEKLASLQWEVRVPLTDIRGATDDEGFRGAALGFRSPGTNIPGVLDAGTYRKQGDRQFVYVTRGTHPLVIELKGKRWDRIILGVADARAEAARINALVRADLAPL